MKNKKDDLIEGCKKGNRISQLQLYDRYCDAMFTIACRYLQNENDAKDAMQEGFIKFFLHIDQYNPEFSIGVWLKRIVINTCIDVLKSKKMVFAPIEGIELANEHEDGAFDLTYSKNQILAAIALLGEKYRVVVTLYMIEGYDHSEIAEILHIPKQTSRTCLRRGKIQLQKFLKEL